MKERSPPNKEGDTTSHKEYSKYKFVLLQSCKLDAVYSFLFQWKYAEINTINFTIIIWNKCNNYKTYDNVDYKRKGEKKENTWQLGPKVARKDL